MAQVLELRKQEISEACGDLFQPYACRVMRVLQFVYCILVPGQVLRADPKIGPFIEDEIPFFSSALVVEKPRLNRVRRGVIVRLGDDRWACFDTDLLRWAAVWKAPAGKPPVTLDSMAAISYPNGKAKAKSPPMLQGELIYSSAEINGFGSERMAREKLLAGGKGSVGPLKASDGRWLGLDLRGKTPVLRYSIGKTLVEDALLAGKDEGIQRLLKVAPHSQPLEIRTHSLFEKKKGPGELAKGGLLRLPASKETTVTVLGVASATPMKFPSAAPSQPIFPESYEVSQADATTQWPYRIQPLSVPEASRFIRPTDLAFLSDGTGLMTTFDGDVWRIEDPEGKTPRWTRIASGLFESISIETTPDDRIFTLGRDQITELIDLNGDHHIDRFHNASNAFLQTLQTRDYATSMAIDKDGSFLIAKGGINKNEARRDNELSSHRGTILRIALDGNSTTVLADGLRMPYVGLRPDGAVFASDQQGHHIPSTPIHLIGNDRPFLGFEPTNFEARKPVPPLLWYPYKANRSAAAFASWNKLFLQVSWGGRLFAIETPKTGQPFSWQLPLQLDFPSLNAVRHPESGRLYAIGLGISGYKPTTPNLSGVASIEEIGDFPKPVAMDVASRTIAVTFDQPLKENDVLIPATPALRLFDVKRTNKYGSGHYRWDGTAGEFQTQPRSFEISDDRRTYTLRFDQVFKAGLLDLHLTLTAGDKVIPLHLFSRPAHLGPPDFEGLAVLAKDKPKLRPGNAKAGKPLFTSYACAGCHSLDGSKLVGPTLKGIGGRADKAFLKQSIVEPNAVITKGFPAAMPSFAGMLNEQQLEDLLAYLKTLR